MIITTTLLLRRFCIYLLDEVIALLLLVFIPFALLPLLVFNPMEDGRDKEGVGDKKETEEEVEDEEVILLPGLPSVKIF